MELESTEFIISELNWPELFDDEESDDGQDNPKSLIKEGDNEINPDFEEKEFENEIEHDDLNIQLSNFFEKNENSSDGKNDNVTSQNNVEENFIHSESFNLNKKVSFSFIFSKMLFMNMKLQVDDTSFENKEMEMRNTIMKTTKKICVLNQIEKSQCYVFCFFEILKAFIKQYTNVFVILKKMLFIDGAIKFKNFGVVQTILIQATANFF